MDRNNSLLSKIVFASLALTCIISSAAAEDDVSVSAGVRLWSSNWQGNSFRKVGASTVAVHLDSPSTIVTMPIISVRYGDFGVSLSQFLNKSFSLSDGLETNATNRREYDLNALYSLAPGLSVGVGYKQLNFPEVVIKGPTLSLSGSAPISERLGIYVTGGIGRLDADIGPAKKLATDYVLSEFGFTYSFANDQKFLKSLVATVGYRNQKVIVKNAPFLDGRNFTDGTNGPTFGLIGSF